LLRGILSKIDYDSTQDFTLEQLGMGLLIQMASWAGWARCSLKPGAKQDLKWWFV